MRQWDGVAFTEIVNKDFIGVDPNVHLPQQLTATLTTNGFPLVAWTDPTIAQTEVFLRGNPNASSGTRYESTFESGVSVQAILDEFDLGPGDVIYANNSPGTGHIVISANDSGVTIIGGSVSLPNVKIDGASDVTLQRVNVGTMTVTGATRFTFRESTAYEVTISGGQNIQLSDNPFLPKVTLRDGAQRVLFEGHRASTLWFTDGGATDVVVTNNDIDTIHIDAPSSGRIARNHLTTINVTASFDGLIEDNDIGGFAVGVRYEAPATFSGNRIAHSEIGVIVNLDNDELGFGFVEDAEPNQISNNEIGVRIDDGRMQRQEIFDNEIGATGTGVFGPDDLQNANRLSHNVVGAQFNGTVQFNQFHNNQLHVRSQSGQAITHNVMSGDGESAIEVAGSSRVLISDNTIYARSGDAVHLKSESSEVEVRGNILWAETGHSIYVAEDSQSGFFSDFNVLHRGSEGTLVHFDNLDFDDILDWQQDVNRFDLHSQGTTVVNPLSAMPRLKNRFHGDFRDLSQFNSWPDASVDVNDARDDVGAQHDFANLLTNPDFEDGLTGWTTNSQAAVQSSAPLPFEGQSYFAAGDVAVGEARQIIDLVAAGYSAGELDSRTLTIAFGARVRSGNQTQPGQAQVTIVFLNENGDAIGEATDVHSETADRWHLNGGRADVPAGIRRLRFEFAGSRGGDQANDVFLDHAFVRVMPQSFGPDVGAFSGDSFDRSSTSIPRIVLQSPNLYVDWERDRPHDIRWESFGNGTNSAVRIELFQDGVNGPSLVKSIAQTTEDDGSFLWTPANDNIAYGTHGLRISVTLVANSVVLDRSIEAFSVPENSASFFVNDQSVVGDEYATAPGSNRNTGRTANSPKSNPVTLLRTYILGPTHTLFVDDGSYQLHSPIVLSGAGVRGDDEGFILTGPAGETNSTQFKYPHPAITGPMMELDDADSMTIRHLELRDGPLGLLVGNGSTNLSATDLVVRGHSGDGIRVEGDSTGTVLKRLIVAQNEGHGIFGFSIAEISDSTVEDNWQDGIHIEQAGSFRIENNRVQRNHKSGIVAYSPSSANAGIIGNDDLALKRGNIVHHNRETGILASSGITVAGNIVFGHLATDHAGIMLSNAIARRNIVFDNFFGIHADTFHSQISENRVYDNRIGIGDSSFEPNVQRNVVYSNETGIHIGPLNSQFTIHAATVTNNLVYGNAGRAILANSLAPGSRLSNNTIDQPHGDGIVLEGRSVGAVLRDNIVWVNSGRGLVVSEDSQSDFDSDFNLIYATGSGRVGRWQNRDRDTLAAWRNASGEDLNSLSTDPLFVDRDGSDNILGFSSNSNGSDDDFHLTSVSGSVHGGGFAPIRDSASGLPIFSASNLIADSVSSPGLDRGDDLSPFANEPQPNGNFVDLGAYGNTEQASRSPETYITLLSPTGGETWPKERQFSIRWRSHDRSATATIELVKTEGTEESVALIVAPATENDGEFIWTVPSDLPAGVYSLRITRDDVDATFTSRTFEVIEPITAYYVNIPDDEDLSDNEHTSASGDFGNDGLSPETPVDSIQSLLNLNITFKPGDVILIDSGVYQSTSNIALTAALSGVTIQGPMESGHSAVIDRGNESSGSYVIEIVGADGLTLSGLRLPELRLEFTSIQ